jgi:thioester reductase-like protein
MPVSHSIPRSDRDYVLVTGSTGLVGQYLVRELLAAGQRLALVVRPSKKLTARERVEVFMQRWEAELGTSLPRPVVLTGDVCDENLGLSIEELDWVSTHCGRVIHSAAVLTFHGKSMDDDPWKTNLGGTKNVISLCEQFNIEELHYLSTAYVCGKRTDRVMETDLDRGQDFRNDYERCKCQAEQLVHASEIESKTIYRPAVIVGDSKTGYTVTYHGLYLYLRLMATLVPQQKRNEKGLIETKIRLPMDGDEPRNLVPVDWVAEVVAHIFLDRSAHGQTYHLTPDEYSSARQVIEYGYEYFGSEGVEFVGSGAPRDPDSEFAARFFENAGMYEDYETSDPEFDKTALIDVAGHLKCPAVDRDMVFRFMDFGSADRWGKRKPKAPEVSFWGAEQRKPILDAVEGFEDISEGSVIGVDLHGPGGGQWKIFRDAAGSLHFEPGLPTEENPQVVAGETGQLAAAGGNCWQQFFESAFAAKA